MIMVTHNPDLECYANRILYIHNGLIEKQIINRYQCQYFPEEYQEKVNAKRSIVCYSSYSLDFCPVIVDFNCFSSFGIRVELRMEELAKVTERAFRFITRIQGEMDCYGCVCGALFIDT